uniref:Uncharacterized protein n=1 Tax=Ditylenchus dipsaci TaxID=166011 RepID=A0A915DF51_9BILA
MCLLKWLNSAVKVPKLGLDTARFSYTKYNEKGAIVDLPSCVLPWATVTVSFNSSGSMTRYLLLPNERDALMWTGSLKLNEAIVESVDLLSPLKEGVKPSGFCSTLEVDSLHAWSSLLHYFPIGQLVSAPQLNGAVSYFTLSQQSSPLFKRIHNTLRKAQLGGVSVLPNQSSVFVLPNGELTSLLGLPSHEMPTFHCLFFSLETSDVMEYSLDTSNPMDLCTSQIQANASKVVPMD